MEKDWPQLLSDYGPYALLPLSILIERTAAQRAKDPKLPETTRNWVYAAAWVTIFLLCGAVVGFWYQNRPKAVEAMMRGKVSGLQLQQRLRGTGPEAANVRVFTYRDPQLTDQLFWRTFSAGPLDESSELAFLIDSSTKESEETLRFPFRTNKSYYGAGMEVRLRFNPHAKKLVFENAPAGTPAELTGEPIVITQEGPAATEHSGSLLPWFGLVAYAQSKPSLSAAIINLDADDPLVRLTARKQLASLGPEAVTSMDKALSNLDSTYRVKLGIIVAANQMPRFKAEALSTRAWCEIWRSAQSGDTTLKGQAELLLKKQPKTVDPKACLDLRTKDYQLKTSEALKVYKR